jgi:hypothetical protein
MGLFDEKVVLVTGSTAGIGPGLRRRSDGMEREWWSTREGPMWPVKN